MEGRAILSVIQKSIRAATWIKHNSVIFSYLTISLNIQRIGSLDCAVFFKKYSKMISN